MSHLRKIANGKYEARYRDTSGRELSRRFPTKRAAQQFLERVGTDQQRGEWRDPAGGRRLLRDWIEEWWETTVNLRPSSRARDGSYIRNHVLPAFGHLPLARISQLAVRAWVAELDHRGLAPATVHKAYQSLSKILQAAVDAGLIARSPCENVPLPRIEREEMRFLSPDEITTLACKIDARYRAMVVLDAYTGLRVGELVGLRRRRLDLLRRTLQVAETAVEVHGELLFGAPKTRAGHRTVPFPSFVGQALDEHLSQFVSPGANAHVFTAPEGGPLRPAAWRARCWQPAVRASGLGHVRPHDLRHTAVSLWIAAGASPKQIAAWAGHTSVSVVLDRYGHLYPGHEADVLTRLDALGNTSSTSPEGSVVPLHSRAP
ncbi:MAG: tyrosine-type recombinase/integrase [Acidimicrobiia bacterium]